MQDPLNKVDPLPDVKVMYMNLLQYYIIATANLQNYYYFQFRVRTHELSQKMTVAAIAMADKKVCAQRS